MKIKCKYTLITLSSGIIGSILMIMLCTGRVDIWNLPYNYLVGLIALLSFIGLYFGALMLYAENKVWSKSEGTKEYQIGETFEYKGAKLIVKEDESGDCWYCKFDDEIYGCMKPFDLKQYCNRKDRKDKKNVVFVKKDRLCV